MRVSAKSEYGVRAMVQLARAYGQGAVPLSQVAERERIPLDFLEQLMVSLRHHDLVQSVRGAHGGYLLSRPPADISVGDVMRALDGPMVPVSCVDAIPADQQTCNMGIVMLDCSTRDVWVMLYEKITQTLEGVSLADLCPTERQSRAVGRIGQPMAVAAAE